MKQLSNKVKRVLTVCLAFIMVLTVLPAVPAQAATENVTMYVGEKTFYHAHGIISGATSTKTGIVEVAKNTKHSGGKGKASVSVKDHIGGR